MTMPSVTHPAGLDRTDIQVLAEALLRTELLANGVISTLVVDDAANTAWLDYPEEHLLARDYMIAAQFLQVWGHMSASGLLVSTSTDQVNLGLFERYLLRCDQLETANTEVEPGA